MAVNIRKGTRVNAPGQEYEDEGEEGGPDEAYYGTGVPKPVFRNSVLSWAGQIGAASSNRIGRTRPSGQSVKKTPSLHPEAIFQGVSPEPE